MSVHGKRSLRLCLVGLLLATCAPADPPQGQPKGPALAPTRVAVPAATLNPTIVALKDIGTALAGTTVPKLPGIEGEVPKPGDAIVLGVLGPITTLQTSLSITDAVGFYDQALAALGWKKSVQTSFAISGTQITYNKDAFTLTLVANPEGSRTTVTLSGAELK